MAGIGRFVKTIQKCGERAEIIEYHESKEKKMWDGEPEREIILKFNQCKGFPDGLKTKFFDYGSDIGIFRDNELKYSLEPSEVILKWGGYAGAIIVSGRNDGVKLPSFEEKYGSNEGLAKYEQYGDDGWTTLEYTKKIDTKYASLYDAEKDEWIYEEGVEKRCCYPWPVVKT